MNFPNPNFSQKLDSQAMNSTQGQEIFKLTFVNNDFLSVNDVYKSH